MTSLLELEAAAYLETLLFADLARPGSSLCVHGRRLGSCFFCDLTASIIILLRDQQLPALGLISRIGTAPAKFVKVLTRC